MGDNHGSASSNEQYFPLGFEGPLYSPSHMPSSTTPARPGSSHSTTIVPIATPTVTPKQKTGFLGTNLPIEYGYALVTVLVIIIVAGLSLAYLKKLRKTI